MFYGREDSLLMRRNSSCIASVGQLSNLRNSCQLHGAGAASDCMLQGVCHWHRRCSSSEGNRLNLKVLMWLGSPGSLGAVNIANPAMRHCLHMTQNCGNPSTRLRGFHPSDPARSQHIDQSHCAASPVGPAKLRPNPRHVSALSDAELSAGLQNLHVGFAYK